MEQRYLDRSHVDATHQHTTFWNKMTWNGTGLSLCEQGLRCKTHLNGRLKYMSIGLIGQGAKMIRQMLNLHSV